MFYAGESFGDEWDVWVGAFGCGGTYRLVRTAIAGIALTSLLGLGTGAVF